jgi:hypothetical protein
MSAGLEPAITFKGQFTFETAIAFRIQGVRDTCEWHPIRCIQIKNQR